MAILVLQKTTLATLLQGKWSGMKQALTHQDLPQASRHFTAETQGLYQEILTTLHDTLPQLAQDMPDIQLISAAIQAAKCRLRRQEFSAGQLWTATYPVYFMMDSDGLWKIYRY